MARTHQHPPPLAPGDQFGRLTVLGEAERYRGQPVYLCRCSCGAQKAVRSCALRAGRTRSCGCLRSEIVAARNTTHGHTTSGIPPIYRVWADAKNRCTNPAHHNWKHYGGRGITMCALWREDFEAFLEDVGERPSPDLSIDRIDNDGGYWCGHCAECRREGWPANTRWATAKEQVANRRPRHKTLQVPEGDQEALAEASGLNDNQRLVTASTH